MGRGQKIGGRWRVISCPCGGFCAHIHKKLVHNLRIFTTKGSFAKRRCEKIPPERPRGRLPVQRVAAARKNLRRAKNSPSFFCTRAFANLQQQFLPRGGGSGDFFAARRFGVFCPQNLIAHFSQGRRRKKRRPFFSVGRPVFVTERLPVAFCDLPTKTRVKNPFSP